MDLSRLDPATRQLIVSGAINLGNLDPDRRSEVLRGEYNLVGLDTAYLLALLNGHLDPTFWSGVPRAPGTGDQNNLAGSTGTPNNAQPGLDAEGPTPGIEQYAVPRARGRDPNDTTSFLAAQADWSADNLPDILFEWRRGDRQNPAYEPEVRRDPTTGEPVVDSSTGRPLRIFRNVPEFLSTQVEGWLLEAIMREDSRITLKDLHAHMRDLAERPRSVNALQMRTKRFRERHRIASWNRNDISSSWNQEIARQLTAEQKEANTTRGLGPYSATELRDVRKTKEGTVPQRSRKRKGSEETADQKPTKRPKGAPKAKAQVRKRKAADGDSPDGDPVQPKRAKREAKSRRVSRHSSTNSLQPPCPPKPSTSLVDPVLLTLDRESQEKPTTSPPDQEPVVRGNSRGASQLPRSTATMATDNTSGTIEGGSTAQEPPIPTSAPTVPAADQDTTTAEVHNFGQDIPYPVVSGIDQLEGATTTAQNIGLVEDPANTLDPLEGGRFVPQQLVDPYADLSSNHWVWVPPNWNRPFPDMTDDEFEQFLLAALMTSEALTFNLAGLPPNADAPNDLPASTAPGNAFPGTLQELLATDPLQGLDMSDLQALPPHGPVQGLDIPNVGGIQGGSDIPGEGNIQAGSGVPFDPSFVDMYDPGLLAGVEAALLEGYTAGGDLNMPAGIEAGSNIEGANEPQGEQATADQGDVERATDAADAPADDLETETALQAQVQHEAGTGNTTEPTAEATGVHEAATGGTSQEAFTADDQGVSPYHNEILGLVPGTHAGSTVYVPTIELPGLGSFVAADVAAVPGLGPVDDEATMRNATWLEASPEADQPAQVPARPGFDPLRRRPDVPLSRNPHNRPLARNAVEDGWGVTGPSQQPLLGVYGVVGPAGTDLDEGWTGGNIALARQRVDSRIATIVSRELLAQAQQNHNPSTAANAPTNLPLDSNLIGRIIRGDDLRMYQDAHRLVPPLHSQFMEQFGGMVPNDTVQESGEPGPFVNPALEERREQMRRYETQRRAEAAHRGQEPAVSVGDLFEGIDQFHRREAGQPGTLAAAWQQHEGLLETTFGTAAAGASIGHAPQQASHESVQVPAQQTTQQAGGEAAPEEVDEDDEDSSEESF